MDQHCSATTRDCHRLSLTELNQPCSTGSAGDGPLRCSTMIRSSRAPQYHQDSSARSVDPKIDQVGEEKDAPGSLSVPAMHKPKPGTIATRDETVRPPTLLQATYQRELHYGGGGCSRQQSRPSVAKCFRQRSSHSQQEMESSSISTSDETRAPAGSDGKSFRMAPVTFELSPHQVRSSASNKSQAKLPEVMAVPTCVGGKLSNISDVMRASNTRNRDWPTVSSQESYCIAEGESKYHNTVSLDENLLTSYGTGGAGDRIADSQLLESRPSASSDMSHTVDANTLKPKSSLLGRLSARIGFLARKLLPSSAPDLLSSSAARENQDRNTDALFPHPKETATLVSTYDGSLQEGSVGNTRLIRAKHIEGKVTNSAVEKYERRLSRTGRSPNRRIQTMTVCNESETVGHGEMGFYDQQDAASGTSKAATLDSSGTCMLLLKGQGDSQGHEKHTHLHLQGAIQKVQTRPCELVVMTAAAETHKEHRKGTSRKSHKKHGSGNKGHKKSSKSSSRRKHGGSRGEGGHRSHRKSRSSKHKREKGGKQEDELADERGNDAGSTFDKSGKSFRTFDFGISSVPVTRGTLPRPELTRTSETGLVSSTWLAEPDNRASVEVRPPTLKSSLRQGSAYARTDNRRDKAVASGLPVQRKVGLQKEMNPTSGTSLSPQESEIKGEAKESASDLLPGQQEVDEHAKEGVQSPPSERSGEGNLRKTRSKSREKRKHRSKSKSKRSSKRHGSKKKGLHRESSKKTSEEEKRHRRNEKKFSPGTPSSPQEASDVRGSPKRSAPDVRPGKPEVGEAAREGVTSPPSERNGEGILRKSRKSKKHRSESKSKQRSKRHESKAEKSDRESPRHKKHGKHRKHERDGKRKKRYTPEGAPGSEPQKSGVFRWSTAGIPSVAGVHRELIWSTTQMQPDGSESSTGFSIQSRKISPSESTRTLPFSSFSTSAMAQGDRGRSRDKDRTASQLPETLSSGGSSERPGRERRERADKYYSRHRSHGHRSGHRRHGSHERREHHGSHKTDRSKRRHRSSSAHRSHAGHRHHHHHHHHGHGDHRSRKDREEAGSPDERRPPSRSGDEILTSASSREHSISPTGSLSPESSIRKSGRHKHHRRHRERHRSERRRHSKRSRSRHKRSSRSRSESERSRSPRSPGTSSLSQVLEKSATPERSSSKRRKTRRSRSPSKRSHRSTSSGRSRSKRSRSRSSHSRSRRRRHKHRSRSPEITSPYISHESSIARERSRSKTGSGSRHSMESRSRRRRRSRSRSSRSRSRSRSPERTVDERSKKRRSRRSRAKRSKGSESVTRSELRTSSSKRKHGRKKRHHRHTSRGKSRHRRHGGTRRRSREKHSRSSRSSREKRRRKKDDGHVVEDYARPSSMTFWYCLFSCTGALLTGVVCVIAICYAIMIKPKPVITTEAEPLTTTMRTDYTAYARRWITPEYTVRSPPVVPTSEPKPQVYYCSTEHCRREASYVGKLLSHESRPCDNFYKHVCDVWMSEHPAHSSSAGSLVSPDTLLQDSLTRQLLDVVSTAGQRDIQVAAQLYATCIDRGSTTTGSKEAVNALFSQWKIEKWPRTDQAQDAGISVWLFAAELVRDLDLATIVQSSVGVDPNNTAATVVELAQPRCLCADINQGSQEAQGLFKAAVRESVAQLGVSSADGLEDRLLAACTAIAAVCRMRYEDNSVTIVRFRELTFGLRAFLIVLLNGRVHEDDHVVLRSAPDLPRQLEDALQSVPPLDALNYFGFLVLVRIAPFLPDDLRNLRDVFAESLLGHTVGNSEDKMLLCARLVESVLPGCFAKAAQIWRNSTGQEFSTREWLSQLESVFLKHLEDFPWINEMSSLFIRYRTKRRALTRFGPSASDQEEDCAPMDLLSVGNAFLFFANVSQRQQARKLQKLHTHGTLPILSATGSEISTEPSFQRSLRVIHVPAALLNASVPSNSSFFVFHLARVAVRFYRALAQLLHEDPYERDTSLGFTEESRRTLFTLLRCFDEDVKSSLARTGASPTSEGATHLRRAFLDRTSALLLATKAFDELFPLRRIWNYDLRLPGLEELTAKQLFFIYFALDNCESFDPSFHKPSVTPEYRVNVPLRHIKEFAQAFGCNAQDHMVSEGNDPCTLMLRSRQRRIGRPQQNESARRRVQYPSMDTRVHP